MLLRSRAPAEVRQRPGGNNKSGSHMTIDAALASLYSDSRAGLAPALDSALVLLQIGECESRVVAGTADAARDHWSLPLGASAIGGQPFRHDPPAPIDLENAIAVVEDALVPLAKAWTRPAALLVSGESVGPLVTQLSAGQSEAFVTRDAVENLFQMMVARASLGVAGGGEASSERVSPSTLLILREFLHHLGFDAAHLVPRLSGPAPHGQSDLPRI